jgi:hypothetical protein
MIAIIRPTKYITALSHPIRLAELFGTRFGVVMAIAQGRKVIEGRERLCGRTLFAAVLRDRRAMVDRGRRHNFTDLKARLTQRIALKFL